MIQPSINRLDSWFCRAATTLTLILMGACLAGCGRAISDGALRLVNVQDAQAAVNGQRKLMGLAGTRSGAWVDPRSPADFQAGHIPGALNVPFERVSAEHGRLREFDVLVVYGSDYNDARALGMSKRLMELGHSDVRTLHGGLRAWRDAGNALEHSE